MTRTEARPPVRAMLITNPGAGHRHAEPGDLERCEAILETAGIGLDAEMFGATRHAERGDWRRALRRAWRWVTHQSVRIAITVDGHEHRHRALQVLVMNSPYYGWSLLLLPNVTMNDGLLD